MPEATFRIMKFTAASCLLLLFVLFATAWGGISEPGKENGFHGLSLPADFRVFAADSPWNRPISANPKIDPASPLMISTLASKARRLKGDMTQWTIPLFVVDGRYTPRRTVYGREPFHPSVDPDVNGQVEGLPLPNEIWPDPQSDGHLIVVDLAERRSWEFSRAKQLPDGNWKASRVARWDLDGPGYVTPFAGKRWWMFGALGSGMPLLAGLIRPEEIAHGEIKHALLCATPVNRRALSPTMPVALCSPAARSDGSQNGPQYIPMGARIQLDPALDLDSLGLAPETKVVARAMQVYGLYNGASSEDFKVFFQNLGADGGRWTEMPDFGDLRKIPLDRFRVLECQIVSKGR